MTAFLLGMAVMYLLTGGLMAARLGRMLGKNFEPLNFFALVVVALAWPRGILWERRK